MYKVGYALVALSLELVVRTTRLQQRLVNPSTTRNNTDRRTAAARHRLFRAARQTDARLVLVRRVADDGGVVARGAGKSTTVTCFLFDVADDGTFGELGDGEDVSDVQSGLLAAVDESTGVETFGGNEGFLTELVAVGITEDNSHLTLTMI